MDDERRIVIIGAGAAGVSAAVAARKADPCARITLVTEEAGEPYERPPLSKAVLLGRAAPEDAPIAGKAGIGAHGIEIRSNRICMTIDRSGRRVLLQSGEELPYDSLVLATGARNRRLEGENFRARSVCYLRNRNDALELRSRLRDAGSVLIVGAGLIGLEIAAVTAELGIRTTVLEAAPRVMPRMNVDFISDAVHQTHRQRGVVIHLSAQLSKFESSVAGGVVAELRTGDRVEADIAVVGIGVVPEDRLAGQAGLATRDGIVVDSRCRTKDPTIFAAGDCARFPGPLGRHVRLENWRHAQEQGSVAGKNAAGADVSYAAVPSFWSEQYDLYIQGVGWFEQQGDEIVTRKTGEKSFVTLALDKGSVINAIGINVQREMATIRRMIERKTLVDAADLADPEKPLSAMLATR